jgi:hypothetical protein
LDGFKLYHIFPSLLTCESQTLKTQILTTEWRYGLEENQKNPTSKSCRSNWNPRKNQSNDLENLEIKHLELAKMNYDDG